MIEINNLTKSSVNKKLLKGIIENVLKGENQEKENLSIVFVGAKRIRELNKKYRKKDKPTDVLSFSAVEKFPDIPELELGEIVICPQIVKKNAKKFNIEYNKELNRVLVHGVLHILGYEHENTEKEAKKMFGKQEKYLLKV
ncbi:MAG: rRNA maturation RNase YbeY [Candidatus Nealsonbacteria bacterium]